MEVAIDSWFTFVLSQYCSDDAMVINKMCIDGSGGQHMAKPTNAVDNLLLLCVYII